ncbi:chaperonin 10-like protein [Fomitopsis serialis]|uniref:chaperonin 10-like protein n=1 Tax=Fomitopsis serialis TaxID=139415 RepID=UPI0020078ECB|nr:chaperonin 10-like protein [Neoantrodia serialis]KAH9924837.1 chaperonin 10-like protein [Neoantrodia serialis]
MSDQKALYLTEKHGAFVLGTAPMYKPGPGEILIRIESTGLNPADWAIQTYGMLIEKYPAILGIDIAGTVEELGEGVTRYKKGDRILTKGTIGKYERTAFQQYALGYEDTSAKIPEGLSFDQAATIPLGLCTAAVALYHDGVNVIGGTCGLTPAWEDEGRGKYEGRPVVVLSGAGSVGQAAIQLLKLSGFNPLITTASLSNAEYLKQLGATHVLDRKLPSEELYKEIRKIASKPLTTVFDAAGFPETQNLGYDLLASGGTMAAVRPDAVNPDKKVDDKKSFFMYADVTLPQNRKLGASLFGKLTELLETGDLKPNHVEVAPGGLEGIIPALEKLKNGVSCVKLVAHPQEST